MRAGKRRACLVWARQHGKDFACWNFLIWEALGNVGTYFYIFPEFSHGKRVIWNGITMDGRRYIDQLPAELILRKSSSEMSIELINGSRIQIVGSANYDALRGTPLKGAVLSEYAYQNPNVWDLVLDPVFSNKNNKDAWVVFNSTPQGKNHFYDLFEYAKSNPAEWFTSVITNEETGLVSQTDLNAKRARGLSEEMLQQEYYCSFDCGVVGSIYGRLLEQANRDGRVGRVSYDPNFLVYTAWDIGVDDAASIIWYQKRGNEILIIDHYENSGYGAAHYANEIKSRPYAYGTHFLPHDGKRRDFSSGSAAASILRDLGLNVISLENNVGLIDGIERCRGTFSRFHFDKEKTDYLRRCLQQYHYERDEKYNVQRTVPKHDWSSHSADALRYLALSIDLGIPGGGMTPEELRKLRQNAGVTWQQRVA